MVGGHFPWPGSSAPCRYGVDYVIRAAIDKIRAIRERSAHRQAFLAALMEAVDDGQLTLEEVSQLDALKSAAGLSDEDIAAARIEAYCRAFAVAKADRTITDDELIDLKRLKSYLGLSDADIQSTQWELSRLRLLTEIQRGNLPTGSDAGVVLRRGEVVHWREPGSLLEERVVRRRCEGVSQGVSIRIMKGVSYRIGQQRGQLVSATGLVAVSSGDLILTSKRILFHGDRKSFAFTYEKLLGVEMYTDGVRLTADTGNPRLVRLTRPENLDVLGSVLSQLVNRASE